MGFRSLISFGLLAVPIGATLAVLLSLDAYRASTGQAPLFVNNGISNNTYCQKAFGIHPDTDGQGYTLNPNQWGWNPGEPGGLCMNVTSFNNGSYATNTTAPQFSVTWQYPQGPQTQPVHAFPNIMLAGTNDVIPALVQTVTNIYVDAEWTYGIGKETAAHTDFSLMTTDLVNANVAIDMFLDDDKSKSADSTQAQFEVMVWLATFGSATQPIGLDQGAISTQAVNGTTFNLYAGQNSLGQEVLTWQATTPVETFIGDIAPLITVLSTLGRSDFPGSNAYLGYMGLGSECLWSNYNVTFSVPKLSIDIKA